MTRSIIHLASTFKTGDRVTVEYVHRGVLSPAPPPPPDNEPDRLWLEEFFSVTGRPYLRAKVHIPQLASWRWFVTLYPHNQSKITGLSEPYPADGVVTFASFLDEPRRAVTAAQVGRYNSGGNTVEAEWWFGDPASAGSAATPVGPISGGPA